MPNKPKICKPSPPPLPVVTGLFGWIRWETYELDIGIFEFELLAMRSDVPFGTTIKLSLINGGNIASLVGDVANANGQPGGTKLRIVFTEFEQSVNLTLITSVPGKPNKGTTYRFFTRSEE
jgi:hypothetical protein